MKLFTKLALVSAIAVSGQAMAMQSMNDDDLSATTGQDGISLTIKADKVNIQKLLVHDNDGIVTMSSATPPAPVVGNAGAIVVRGVGVKVDSANATNATFNDAYGATALAGVRIDTDGGTNTDGSGAVLNIGVALNATQIDVAGIDVGKSNTVASMTGARRGTMGTDTNVIGDLSVNIGVSKLNIQLGNTTQGGMIVANGTINNGITINGLELIDRTPGNGGSIGIDQLKVTSANNTDLIVDTTIGVKSNGLSIKSTGSNDIYMSAVRLGSATAASIGAVEIQGMSMTNSEILVSGH